MFETQAVTVLPNIQSFLLPSLESPRDPEHFAGFRIWVGLQVVPPGEGLNLVEKRFSECLTPRAGLTNDKAARILQHPYPFFL